MHIEALTPMQVRDIYKTRMVKDFPREELKPLKMIIKSMKKKKYECFGLIGEGKILAYAFFVRTGNDYLFDYLAVDEECRNKGNGSDFLKLLSEQFGGIDSVIGEVEDPEFAASEEERRLRERRLGFYYRNGLTDTGISVYLFGVDFKVLEIPINGTHSQDEIRALYMKHYQSFLPKFICKRNVKIKN